MNGRINLQETAALLLTKMEVKEELQMNRGAVDDLDIGLPLHPEYIISYQSVKLWCTGTWEINLYCQPLPIIVLLPKSKRKHCSTITHQQLPEILRWVPFRTFTLLVLQLVEPCWTYTEAI